MMKSLFSLAVAAVLTACTAVPVLAQANWVRSGMACPLEVVETHVLPLQTSLDAVSQAVRADLEAGRCQVFPATTFEVVSEASPFYTDYEGDRFILLQIGEGIYTIGWPGLSTDVFEPDAVEAKGWGGRDV